MSNTNNCYDGISIPTLIEEPCDGKYTLDNCSVHAAAIPYLSLPANSSLALVIQNIVLSLQAKDALIEDLQNQINSL